MNSRRIVIKIGSSSLASLSGTVSKETIHKIADAVSHYRGREAQILLVSSGAMVAGLASLGLAKRPTDLATLQAAASVGQGVLVAEYSKAFASHSVLCSQVLLTNGDFVKRKHFTNALNTMERLLALGVLPIINENDTVATDEIRFGDNDRLAMLLAHMINADELLLLSDVDCVYDAPARHHGKPIFRVTDMQQVAAIKTWEDLPHVARVGTGGMGSKIRSAAIAADNGIKTTITSVNLIWPALQQIFDGDGHDSQQIGTVFMPWGSRRPLKTLWLEHVAQAEGTLVVDQGAKLAIVERHASLLFPGIIRAVGGFETKDIVDIKDSGGTIIAKGVANYGENEINGALEDHKSLGDVVVHTDNIVVV